MSEWISVNEKLPQPGRRVLLHAGGFIGEGWCSGTRWLRNGRNVERDYDAAVTHWMPLPEPPKEETA